MRSSRPLLAGSVLILVGCATPGTPASDAAREATASARPAIMIEATPLSQVDATGEASPRSDAGATVGATPSPQDREPLSLLQNRLQQARTKIEDEFRANPDKYKLPNPHVPFCFKPPFPVLAPADLAGYDADPLVESAFTDMGAWVKARLVDRGDARRWVEFWQGLGCYGVAPEPPQGATDIEQPHPAEIPGMNASRSQPQLQSWKEPDGSSIVLLLWYSDVWSSPNTLYQLTGHNMQAETIIHIATTMRRIE